MDFSWTDQQITLKKEASLFGKKYFCKNENFYQSYKDFNKEAWKALHEIGLWRIILKNSKENWWNLVAILEGLAISGADSSFLVSIVAQSGLIYGLQMFGSEDQKKLVFNQVNSGDICATAIAEPHSGSDLSSLKTKAYISERGYILSGEKWNISHASTAKTILVVAKSHQSKGIDLFLVDSDTKGIEISNVKDKIGHKSLPTGNILFNDVVINKKHCLASGKEGYKMLAEITAFDRILYGLCAGILLEPVLEKLLLFASKRKSFQKPLYEHQYIQKRITDIKIGIESARWLSYGAFWQLLSKDSLRYLTSSIAKIVASKNFIEGSQNALALLGSQGYLEGYISDLVKDALGYLNIGGTEEVHRINIFNQLIRQL